MSKENIRLLVNALIMLSISLLFIFTNNRYALKDADDRVFNEVVTLKNAVLIETLPDNNAFEIIYQKYDAVALNGTTIGTIYHVIAYNGYVLDPTKGVGVIELYVGIKENQVYVENITLEQTATYLPLIQHYALNYFEGVLYEEVKTIDVLDADLDASATATDSTSTIKRLVEMVVDKHFNLEVEVPLSLYELYVDGFSQSEEDLSFNPTELVVSKVNLFNDNNELIAVDYILKGTGTYYEDFDPATIQLHVIMKDQVIQSIVILEEEYAHSGGNFLSRINTYVESFQGLTLEEVNAYYPSDWTAGASSNNSKTLVDQLLSALKEILS
jgi:hypothetical protein